MTDPLPIRVTVEPAQLGETITGEDGCSLFPHDGGIRVLIDIGENAYAANFTLQEADDIARKITNAAMESRATKIRNTLRDAGRMHH